MRLLLVAWYGVRFENEELGVVLKKDEEEKHLVENSINGRYLQKRWLRM